MPIPESNTRSLNQRCKPLSVINNSVSSRSANARHVGHNTIAAPMLPAEAVREPTLLFVTEKGCN